MLILLLSILLFSSNVFGEQKLSSITDNECNPETSSWTRWFNTQDPKITNNGNDIEDISSIRNLYPEAVRWNTVSNVEYSVTGKSNNEISFYQTLTDAFAIINKRYYVGLICST